MKSLALTNKEEEDTILANAVKKLTEQSKGQSESAGGIAIIREAGSSFTTITEHVHNVSTQIQEVSATAEEMNMSLNNISSISNEVAAETTKACPSAKDK